MALACPAHQCRLTQRKDSWLLTALTPYITTVFNHSTRSARPHETRHQQYSRTVVTSAAQQQQAAPTQQPSYVIDSELDPQKLLGTLNSTKNYTQLAAYVKSQQQVFLHSPLCVYAILHAVQLKNTISEDKFGTGNLSTEDKVLQQMETVSSKLSEVMTCL